MSEGTAQDSFNTLVETVEGIRGEMVQILRAAKLPKRNRGKLPPAAHSWMVLMKTKFAVTATEFAESFDRYNEEAQRGPVAIVSDGRISGYFISAREYEDLTRLRRFGRRVYRVEELPKEIVEAVEASKMDASHDHLNALLEDDHPPRPV